MIEAVALSLHFAGEGERSSGYYQDLASEALTAAFNSLDIQEKVE
jgi:hypothetical protein